MRREVVVLVFFLFGLGILLSINSVSRSDLQIVDSPKTVQQHKEKFREGGSYVENYFEKKLEGIESWGKSYEDRQLTEEKLMKLPMPTGKKAFVTMLTLNSSSPWDAGVFHGYGFLLTTLVWGYSHQLVNTTHDTVLILYSPSGKLDETDPEYIEALFKLFDRILVLTDKDVARFPWQNTHWQRHLWYKLFVFSLTEYERVMWLGSDVLLYHNIDEIMRCPPPCGDRAVSHNGDMLVLKPDLYTFQHMLWMGSNWPLFYDTKGFDQGFLNSYLGGISWSTFPDNWVLNSDPVSANEYPPPSLAHAVHFFVKAKPWHLLAEKKPPVKSAVWFWRRANETVHSLNLPMFNTYLTEAFNSMNETFVPV